MRIAVIGAGNGGQAVAGFLGLSGHIVSLYDIDIPKIESLKGKKGIQLEGKIKGFGKMDRITTDIAEAVKECGVRL